MFLSFFFFMADHRYKKIKKRKKKTIKSYGSAATLMAADCPGRCKIANNMPQLEAIFDLCMDSNANHYFYYRYQSRVHQYRILPGKDGKLSIQVNIIELH
jgi:hypothetical protein